MTASSTGAPPHVVTVLLHRALWAIDLLAGGVVVYFFYRELGSASMSGSDARYIALFLFTVAAIVFGGAHILRTRGRLLFATCYCWHSPFRRPCSPPS